MAQATAEAVLAANLLQNIQLRDEHDYSCVPLCVIDAVFSIGVRYTGTQATVRRWASAQEPPWELFRRGQTRERTVSDFLSAYRDRKAGGLLTKDFGNTQRTSSRSGIPKQDAVERFALALRDAGIETFADVQDLEKRERAIRLINDIPGQKSGISFKYFLVLCGVMDQVKADRMICRFVARAAKRRAVSPIEAEEAVKGAALILAASHPGVMPGLLDAAIWQHQSRQPASHHETNVENGADSADAAKSRRLDPAVQKEIERALRTGVVVSDVARRFGISYANAHYYKRRMSLR